MTNDYVPDINVGKIESDALKASKRLWQRARYMTLIIQGGSYWRGSIKRPIAWKPLPEPYRESEGEYADSN